MATLIHRRGASLALVGSVAGALFLLLPPLGATGLLEPRELARAELAREVASGTHAWRTVDLGALSSALGFRAFGVHEWSGRLPLAIWALAGVISTYAALTKLMDRRTGVYAAVALATMPLYLEGARTMLVGAVAMSAYAMSLGALAVAVFGEGRRAGWLGVAALGLAAGYAGSGALLGVGLPLVTVGLAWAHTRSAEGPRDRVAEFTGGLALAGGLAACVIGARGSGNVDVAVTFDRGLADAACGLAPWSAFLPFAAGRLLGGDTRAGLRGLLVLACAAAFAADTWSAAHGGTVPFVGAAAVAGVCAIALRDLEKGAAPSVLVAAGTVVLAVLLRHEIVTLPAKGLAALGTDGVVPDAFQKHGAVLWTIALAVFAGGVGLAFLGPLAAPRRWMPPLRRVPVVAAAALASALVLGAGYYPALAGQLSARAALEAYARVRHPGEPLAMLGVSERGAAFTTGEDALAIADPATALAWLDGAAGGRRFLALSDDRLVALNQLFRARSSPHANLPVLDASASHVLLAVSRLEPGEANANPLDRFVLPAPPRPQRPLEASLEDKIDVLGYDLVDSSGRPAAALVTGRPVTMRVYYRVDTPPGAGWQAFLHIDGHGRRYNGDHPLMDGKYPPASWLAGDIVVDAFDIVLPPNFTRGTYRIYFGLFAGEHRMKAVRGAADADGRVDGGDVRVE